MPLQHEYRVMELDKIVGNKSALKGLKAALARDEKTLPHAFLFTGPAGTGKTTCARIVAHMLGCEGLDFRELDTGDFRGIDTAREIRRNMRLAPMREGGRRGWFLDEVHRATVDFQEALLKALEQPPKHVFFFAATTEPEKLKATFKRRMHHVPLAPVGDDALEELLARVLKGEGVGVSEEVLDAIITDSLGSCGVALGLLDAVIDLEPDDQLDAVREQAALKQKAVALCRALMQRSKWRDITKVLRTLDENPESVRRAVLGYCRSVLMNNDSERAFLIMDSFKQPFFDAGDAGARLVHACYEALHA